MNFFMLDYDLRKSAKALDNARLSKMIVETAQIISTAFYIQNGFTLGQMYKPTHESHPVVKWAAEDKINTGFLLMYFLLLNNEYTLRSKKHHKSLDCYSSFRDYYRISSLCFSEPPQCMPEEFQSGDIVEAYRNYYASKRLIRYDVDQIPEWFKNLRKKPYYIRMEKSEKYRLFNPLTNAVVAS